jgi:ABC-type multidrug transport system permease subunit
MLLHTPKKFRFVILIVHLFKDMHHLVEEEKLFPFLEFRLKKKMESEKLQRDHEVMNMYLKKVQNLFQKTIMNEFSIYQKELSEETKNLLIHMKQHLIDEEDVTIPAIILTGFKFGCCTPTPYGCCVYV